MCCCALESQVPAAPLAGLPKPLQRGLDLMGKGQLVDAMQVLSSQLKAAAEHSSDSGSGASLVQSLVQLCQLKLKLPPSKQSEQTKADGPQEGVTINDAPAAAAAGQPLQLLVNAWQHSEQAGKQRGMARLSSRNLREQRAMSARAAGYALAFLLHPAVYAAAAAAGGGGDGGAGPQGSGLGGSTAATSIPRWLVEDALKLFSNHGKAAFSSTNLGSQRASSSTSSSGSSGAMLQRAGDSKVLQELLQLIGLDPVKEDMLNLADQVTSPGAGFVSPDMHAHGLHGGSFVAHESRIADSYIVVLGRHRVRHLKVQL